MIIARFEGSDDVIRRFNEVGVEMQDGIAKTIMLLTFKLQAKVQSEKLSGQVLGTRSNVLRSSINSKVQQYKNSVVGTVGTNVKYAAIHEYGGVINAKNAPYLKFKIGNKWISKKSITMPERSFLRSALKDMTPEIQEAIMTTLRSIRL